MPYCTASTGDGHPATEQVNGLWWCTEHADRIRAIETPPKNLDRLVRKIRRRPHHKRVAMMARLTEAERIWVSKRLAGG